MSQRTEKYKKCPTLGCPGKIRTDEIGKKYAGFCPDCQLEKIYASLDTTTRAG